MKTTLGSLTARLERGNMASARTDTTLGTGRGQGDRRFQSAALLRRLRQSVRAQSFSASWPLVVFRSELRSFR
jgi:hypothetical protein